MRSKMFAAAQDQSVRVTDVFPPVKSNEQMVPIMDALTNDVSGYFQVNIPNNRLISGIPDDVVVEVPAYVSRRGIQGMQVGKMPESVMVQILWPRLAWAERRVSFAKSPGLGLLLNMILHRHVDMENRYSPPVESFEQAEAEAAKILKQDPELAALMAR